MNRHDDYDWLTPALITVILALAAFWLASCVPIPPVPPIPPTPGVWLVDAVACKVAGDVTYACQEPIPHATIEMHGPNGYISKVADDAGYAVFELPAPFPNSDVNISADGYVSIVGQHIDVKATHDSERHNIVVLEPAHVDPSSIPLNQLARIRGAMWTSRLNLPFGPRPNQDDNILAMDFWQLYGSDDQQRMLHQYRDVDGYTHAVTGPLSGTDCYHGDYPCHDQSNPGWFPQDGAPSQAQWDRYLDGLQTWWDYGCIGTGKTWPACGVASIFFVHPDGWTFEQTHDVFTPLLSQPRAQKLIRIVVPSGWEPTRYEWSSCTWALYGAWARQVLPNALVLIHTVTDVDAPVGTDELCDDNGKPNGEGWARVIGNLHGWLIQNGPYYTSPADDPTLAWNFAAQFLETGDGATAHSAAWHFAGNAGWPTFSAWGNPPICLYNAENTSYAAYWKNLPESASVAWGNLAMAGSSVACGYLDGGSMDVPVKR